jgi:hypothetical protein
MISMELSSRCVALNYSYNAPMLILNRFDQAVCVEAGMLALRRGGTVLEHEDYVEGICVVQAKKKTTLNYYA